MDRLVIECLSHAGGSDETSVSCEPKRNVSFTWNPHGFVIPPVASAESMPKVALFVQIRSNKYDTSSHRWHTERVEKSSKVQLPVEQAIGMSPTVSFGVSRDLSTVSAIDKSIGFRPGVSEAPRVRYEVDPSDEFHSIAARVHALLICVDLSEKTTTCCRKGSNPKASTVIAAPKQARCLVNISLVSPYQSTLTYLHFIRTRRVADAQGPLLAPSKSAKFDSGLRL